MRQDIQHTTHDLVLQVSRKVEVESDNSDLYRSQTACALPRGCANELPEAHAGRSATARVQIGAVDGRQIAHCCKDYQQAGYLIHTPAALTRPWYSKRSLALCCFRLSLVASEHNNDLSTAVK